MRKILFVALAFCVAALAAAGASARQPDVIEKTFPFKMGGRLTLDLDTGGGIDIVGWAKEEIAVTAEIDGDDAEDVNVEFDETGRGLRIHSSCDSRWHCDADVRLTLKVPERCDVSIDSKGGSVDIEGVAGTFTGTTMGGSIELLRVKGKVDLETMGGSIDVVDCEADGKVQTMGGSVRIENVKGNLKGSTMGGSVTYNGIAARDGEKPGEEMNVHTMGGDIVIDRTDRKVKAKTLGGDVDVAKGEEVNVSTMGGDVNVDEAPSGAKVSTMGGNVTVGAVGNYLEASTMGGDVEVDAIDGWIEASTMGGDVTVTMVGDPSKGRRDVELSSMGGDITLTVPAGLSMKFDIDLKVSKGKRGRYRIESDFPMKVEETTKLEGFMGNRHTHIYGTGEVAGGEHLVKLSTHNGNIVIKKGL